MVVACKKYFFYYILLEHHLLGECMESFFILSNFWVEMPKKWKLIYIFLLFCKNYFFVLNMPFLLMSCIVQKLCKHRLWLKHFSGGGPFLPVGVHSSPSAHLFCFANCDFVNETRSKPNNASWKKTLQALHGMFQMFWTLYNKRLASLQSRRQNSGPSLPAIPYVQVCMPNRNQDLVFLTFLSGCFTVYLTL